MAYTIPSKWSDGTYAHPPSEEEKMKRHKKVWMMIQADTNWHIISDGSPKFEALCGHKFDQNEDAALESVNLNWVKCEKCEEEYLNILCFHATGMTSIQFSKWQQKQEGEWDYVNSPEETNEE